MEVESKLLDPNFKPVVGKATGLRLCYVGSGKKQ